MTSRIGQPDTPADIELRACLDERPLTSFVMVAGAGSGKTTSLVKALAHLAATRAPELRRRGQQVACITYTEVAVKEIWGDVGNDSLFHVSTIHSFLWTIIRPFQSDLKTWVLARIDEKVAEAQARLDNPRTQARTRPGLERDIERYGRQKLAVATLARFTYGTGSDYAKGVLGHADILKVAPSLIEEKPLLRNLVASRFPFIFVDESQDTVPAFVSALRRIAETEGEGFCLGFFGDPMQKIYTTGVGPIAKEAGWNEITKPENFRCPQRVLRVVNAIRVEDDGLRQTRGRTIKRDGEDVPVEGTAKLFLLPADGRRSNRLAQVRRWMAATNQDPNWIEDRREADVRALVLVHRMAATRLGFPNLYASLNDKAPLSLKDGLDDGSSWVLRPFLAYLLPLVLALRAGRDFDVVSALRAECQLLSKDGLAGQNAAAVLRQLRENTATLSDMLAAGAPTTIRQVLDFVMAQGLAALDERFAPYLADPNMVVDDDSDPEAGPIVAFLACEAGELWGYRHYIEDQSPFATQQGVKGAEFDRVLVIVDDEEGRGQTQISYGKYFGITPLSDTDRTNIEQNLDSVLGRTRRLFYVCCSRAVQDLAVVMFLPDVVAARAQIQAKGLFPDEDVHTEADLAVIPAEVEAVN
jgi:DNA helicase-2/ATP-dependent DNA helicase PcrA